MHRSHRAYELQTLSSLSLQHRRVLFELLEKLSGVLLGLCAYGSTGSFAFSRQNYYAKRCCFISFSPLTSLHQQPLFNYGILRKPSTYVEHLLGFSF